MESRNFGLDFLMGKRVLRQFQRLMYTSLLLGWEYSYTHGFITLCLFRWKILYKDSFLVFGNIKKISQKKTIFS